MRQEREVLVEESAAKDRELARLRVQVALLHGEAAQGSGSRI
jgi:hypothetical protein